jgi:hypothetical protein
MMFIGSIRFGPHVSLTLAARTIEAMVRLMPPEDFPSPVKLDVVYHIGGPLREPEFAGVRTGSYSRKHGIAQVQIAVSSSESDDQEIPRVMVDRLLSAVDAIGSRLKRANADVPVDLIKSKIESHRAEIVRAAPASGVDP